MHFLQSAEICTRSKIQIQGPHTIRLGLKLILGHLLALVLLLVAAGLLDGGTVLDAGVVGFELEGRVGRALEV